MFNCSYQRAARRTPLHGEQLDIGFPRRGRMSRFRRLERAGQMRLNLQRPPADSPKQVSSESVCVKSEPESLEQALDYLFPERPLTDLELLDEFNRLFPPP